MTTQDLDIMPDPEPGNLERLADALSTSQTAKKEAGSTQYISHPEVRSLEFRIERISSYRTSFGVLDVLMELPGIGFYADVSRNAREYQLSDIRLKVASFEDIITSKETVDRAKDWQAMDALRLCVRRCIIRSTVRMISNSTPARLVTDEMDSEGAFLNSPQEMFLACNVQVLAGRGMAWDCCEQRSRIRVLRHRRSK